MERTCEIIFKCMLKFIHDCKMIQTSNKKVYGDNLVKLILNDHSIKVLTLIE